MNGRVYDPEIGRFMSVDPVFQFPENTQSLNPYSYVLNNPLSLTDPSGFATDASIKKAEDLAKKNWNSLEAHESNLGANTGDGYGVATQPNKGLAKTWTPTALAMSAPNGASVTTGTREKTRNDLLSSKGRQSASDFTNSPTVDVGSRHGQPVEWNDTLVFSSGDIGPRLVDGMSYLELQQFASGLDDLRQQLLIIRSDQEILQAAPALDRVEPSSLLRAERMRMVDRDATRLRIYAWSRLRMKEADFGVNQAAMGTAKRIIQSLSKTIGMWFGRVDDARSVARAMDAVMSRRTIQVAPNPYVNRVEIFIDGEIQ
jgi:hypothetical protein